MDTWNDALTRAAYMADLAGLSSHIALEGAEGIEVAVSGFADKLPALVEAVFQVRRPRASITGCEIRARASCWARLL